MTRPDIVMQYCVFCDYPLWREWLKKYRDKFAKVILYPSKQHGTTDLEDFARKVIPETWVERPSIDYGKQDWRQAETDPCIALSDSEWILFMEQDFFCSDWDRLFGDMEKAMKEADMFGVWNASHFPYMHPCFLLIRRSTLDKTRKDFSAHPETPGSDHFAMLTRDAEKLGARLIKLEDYGYKEWEDYYHLGGLTYTFQDWKGNGKDVFGMKSPEAYYVYLHFAENADVEQSPEYLKQAKEIQDTLKGKYAHLDIENNVWTKFYKN